MNILYVIALLIPLYFCQGNEFDSWIQPPLSPFENPSLLVVDEENSKNLMEGPKILDQEAKRNEIIFKRRATLQLWWISFFILIASALYYRHFLKAIFVSFKKRMFPPLQPKEKALRRLVEISKKKNASHLKEKYLSIFEIFRVYMEEEFQWQTPHMTHEEFFRQIPSIIPCGQTKLSELSQILQTSDLIKYADYQPSEDEYKKAYQTIFAWMKNGKQ